MNESPDDPHPRPGTEVLRQQLDVDDPEAWLLELHPPGTRLHRLTAALLAAAADLDAHLAAARQVASTLRLLRTGPYAHVDDPAIAAVAHELDCEIRATELTDTALIRLLGAYLDLHRTPGRQTG